MSKRSGFKKFLGLAAAIGLGVLSAGKAQAGFTAINGPHVGEQSQAQILSHNYGGTFSASGLNLTNGSLTAYRIDDNDDQVLPFDILSTKTLGVFASYKQGLAYGEIGNSTQLFDVTGKGYSAVGGTGAVDVPNPTQLIRTGGGYQFSSLESANVDGKDHLVTYLLVDDSAKSNKKDSTLTFVLFWEDLAKGQKNADWDFNDLAVEVKAAGPVVVPLPAAAWSGIATLAGSAVMAGYRKARRQMA